MKLVNQAQPARLAPRKWTILAALALLSSMAPRSEAALTTNITNVVTDLTAFFGDIQTLVISVVVFGLAIGYAKLLRKK